MNIVKKGLKFGLVILILFILCNVSLYVYCLLTPKPSINKEQSYYLYDNSDALIFNNNKDWIKLDNISRVLVEATISTEDKNFYHHFGFDYLRIVKAFFTNIINGNLSEGASTITMQYARNLFLTHEKTWSRKMQEALLAFELETHYSKDEILEGYLNTINYGGVFGIENASKYYFNKSASELTIGEASMLAGIPQSPSNNNPLNNPDRAKKRQATVLRLMVKNGDISENGLEEAVGEVLSYYGKMNDNDLSSVMYFKDAVISELRGIGTIPKSLIETGGLRVYTTLDMEAQRNLEKSSLEYMGDNELEVSGVMVNPKNGEVMALLGGKDYNKSQFNRATQSKRQVGSVMKPILYYTALESGFTASSNFTSERTTFNLSNNFVYTPKNFNDLYANGPISMGAAISYSDNVYAVKTHLFLGEDALVNMASRLGISSNLKPVASLALGTSEISVIDMVQAYGVFANSGKRNVNHFIRRVEDSKGNVIYEYKDREEVILNPSLVFILNEMLTYTYDNGFIDYNYPTVISLLPKISHKYAIKTGTMDTDKWIIGYNSDAVLGIWIGYDDNRKLVNDGGVHKSIWIDTMEGYFENRNSGWYNIPDNVVGVVVNPITGMVSKDGDKHKKLFYYIKGTEPYGNSYEKDLDEVFKESTESGNSTEVGDGEAE